MSLKSFITLFTATLAYTISIVYGLFQGLSLSDIFINGINVFLLSGIFAWLVVFTIETLAEKNEEKKEDEELDRSANNEISNENNNNGSNNNDIDNNNNNNIPDSDGFSPMTPPVLEVARQELDGGEDNR